MNFKNVYQKMTSARIYFVNTSMNYLDALDRMDMIDMMEAIMNETRQIATNMHDTENKFMQLAQFLKNHPDSEEIKRQILSNFQIVLNESMDVVNRQLANLIKHVDGDKSQGSQTYKNACEKTAEVLNDGYKTLKQLINSNEVNEFLHIKNVTPQPNTDINIDEKEIEKARNAALDAFNSKKINKDQLIEIMNELNGEKSDVKASFIPMITKIF